MSEKHEQQPTILYDTIPVRPRSGRAGCLSCQKKRSHTACSRNWSGPVLILQAPQQGIFDPDLRPRSVPHRRVRREGEGEGEGVKCFAGKAEQNQHSLILAGEVSIVLHAVRTWQQKTCLDSETHGCGAPLDFNWWKNTTRADPLFLYLRST